MHPKPLYSDFVINPLEHDSAVRANGSFEYYRAPPTLKHYDRGDDLDRNQKALALYMMDVKSTEMLVAVAVLAFPWSVFVLLVWLLLSHRP